ncbi:unnamed protein product [Leuciscus chuanchicus]
MSDVCFTSELLVLRCWAEQSECIQFIHARFVRVAQDFDLLFGAETSSKLLEKWDFLKAKVIEQAKDISKTLLLDHLIQSAEENTDEDDEVPGWDSDMASLLMLVYLLPPPPSGKKGAVKISTREAMDHVVKLYKRVGFISFDCSLVLVHSYFLLSVYLANVLEFAGTYDKSCRSLQEHSGPNQRRQPYILAVGTTRKHIHKALENISITSP